MSTTYYLRKSLSSKQKTELKELIDNDDIKKLKDRLNENYYDIILGHRAGGWEFKLYLHNEKYYKPTRQSIIDFANSENYIVVNEYGAIFSIEDFFDKVVDDWNDNKSNNLDAESFFAQSDSQYFTSFSPYSFSYWTSQNFDVNKYGEFHNDNLRWDIGGEQV